MNIIPIPAAASIHTNPKNTNKMSFIPTRSDSYERLSETQSTRTRGSSTTNISRSSTSSSIRSTASSIKKGAKTSAKLVGRGLIAVVSAMGRSFVYPVSQYELETMERYGSHDEEVYTSPPQIWVF